MSMCSKERAVQMRGVLSEGNAEGDLCQCLAMEAEGNLVPTVGLSSLMGSDRSLSAQLRGFDAARVRSHRIAWPWGAASVGLLPPRSRTLDGKSCPSSLSFLTC